MSFDRLDIDRLLQSSLVAQVEYYATITSTNDRAKECAAGNPESLPLLVVADEKTAGRGRGANRWWTGPGSLAFSVLFDAQSLQIPRGQSPLVALAAGVAVTEAIAPRLPSRRVGIRWPNDVYVEDRKVAGVLVEVPSERFIVVGIGLNTNNTLAHAPVEVARTATTLRKLTGECCDQTAVLLTILAELTKWLRELAVASEHVALHCNRLCLQHGQSVTIELGKRTITGCCMGIAADGALLVDTPTGRQSFYSGVLRRL